jgi:hypothetical protein
VLQVQLILFSTPLPTTTLFISQHMQRTAASRTRNKNCYHFRQTQRQSRFCSQDSAIQFFIFTVESVSHLFYLHRSARTTDPEITNSRHNRARLCFPPLSARDVIKRELQKLQCCIWNVNETWRKLQSIFSILRSPEECSNHVHSGQCLLEAPPLVPSDRRNKLQWQLRGCFIPFGYFDQL